MLLLMLLAGALAGAVAAVAGFGIGSLACLSVPSWVPAPGPCSGASLPRLLALLLVGLGVYMLSSFSR
jgi:hypothetical protein